MAAVTAADTTGQPATIRGVMTMTELMGFAPKRPVADPSGFYSTRCPLNRSV
jgi:hypothetical protein